MQVQQSSPHDKAGTSLVSDLGEHALLARLLARLPRPSARVQVGPGDDAAVLVPGRNERLVVTTDAVIEGVHFSRSYFAPTDIGVKALAVNLSDLAAMGATPRWALLSLVLPAAERVSDLEDLVDGFASLAVEFGVDAVGGNIARSNGALMVDVTAGGSVHPRRLLTRSGARPGDEIWISGSIGAAAAGLEKVAAAPDANCACVNRQRRPCPRIRLGVAVARERAARAAMDLSDGLSDAVTQVAAASGVGARIDGQSVPIEECARRWWMARGVDPLVAAVTGGEDYELLFAVPAKAGGRLRAVTRRVADPPLTKIGVFTKNAGELLIDRGGREEALPQGYEHFKTEH